jgi:hypothetical protein
MQVGSREQTGTPSGVYKIEIMQLNIFTNHKCTHCGSALIPDRNPALCSGFRDADTGELVCRSCRNIHYAKKQKELNLGSGMTYSEFPIPINQ